MVMLFAENGEAPVEGRAGAIQSRSQKPLVDGRFSCCRRNIGITSSRGVFSFGGGSLNMHLSLVRLFAERSLPYGQVFSLKASVEETVFTCE
jgi:hypothetical protein